MSLTPDDDGKPNGGLERLVYDLVDAIRDARKALHGLFAATVMLYLLMGGLLFWVSHNASETTSALCALRTEQAKRMEGSKKFLREHPEGFAGIPASTLRVSIGNQSATIRALRNLDC